MRLFLLPITFLCGTMLIAQVYTVNTEDDIDNGVCNAVHCSLREAINAAEADGVPSTILFNVPGAGTHFIIPSGPFPTITKPDLTILGETQPGGPGSVVIDFKYRAFGGIGFWAILSQRFYVSGIDFTEFLFSDVNDHIFRFGSTANQANDSKINNCSFITDNSIVTGLKDGLILILYAPGLRITNCNFGTDHTRSFIAKLDGFIDIGQFNLDAGVTIDSNLFVNKAKMINWESGNVIIERNIFGALDTAKNLNFLNPEYAIRGFGFPGNIFINDNFFIGFQTEAISLYHIFNKITITRNRFYNNVRDIYLSGAGHNDVDIITDNFCRNGKSFLFTDDKGFFGTNIGDLDLERNNINNYDTVYYSLNDRLSKRIRYIDNSMTCINKKVIVYDPTYWPSPKIPIIATVNRNKITGIGNPNDSIVIYSNNRITCPNANCEAGIELGRTQADGAGNWTLNVVYPNKTTISAYQFDSDPSKRPTIYSEFSPCYQCPGQVKTKFTPSLCLGETVIFRGKVYSTINPVDSFVVKGDDVSICDSLFLVQLNINNSYRPQLNVSVCYEDTLSFGAVKIYKSHLTDSLILQSIAGCDSIVLISGKIVGISNYSNSYCDSLSVKIGSTVFDKNNPSGIAIIKGVATSGCDSVIFVNLIFNFSNDTIINQSFCPNQILNVSGQVFDKSRPSGDVVLSKASSSGCDSIIHVNLTFLNTTGFFSKSLCSRDSILIGNQYFSERNLKGTVTLTKATSNGCDSIVNVDLTINPSIQLNFEANDLKCNQANTGELILKDINGGSGNFKVSIDNGAPLIYNQGDTIGNLSQGAHSIRIIDQLNCDTSYSFTINNSQLLSLQLPNDTIIHKGNPVSISANTNFNPISIAWIPNLYLSCDTCLNPQSNPDNTITYILTLIDENGCIVTDNMTITVLIDKAEIFVPSAFSPNGDNINDIFAPVLHFPNSTTIKIFRIFDRWGNQIYERLNGAIGENLGWDGTVNGEKMNPGVYVYTIQFIGDDKIIKWKSDVITLVR